MTREDGGRENERRDGGWESGGWEKGQFCILWRTIWNLMDDIFFSVNNLTQPLRLHSRGGGGVVEGKRDIILQRTEYAIQNYTWYIRTLLRERMCGEGKDAW